MKPSIPLEEIFIEESRGIALSSKDLGWRDLRAFRATTLGGILHVPAQTHHYINVQLGTKPVQVEKCFEGKFLHSYHTLGTANIVPSGVDSRWQFDAPTEDFILAFPQSLLSHVAVQEGCDPATVELKLASAIRDPQLTRLALLMNSHLEDGKNGRLFAEGLASAFASHLLTRYTVHPPKLRASARGLSESDLSRVRAYIADCLADDLSLDDLAASVSLSPYHFARLFKQSTSQSPHRYVITQRVERAKSLLLSGRLTVGEVAQAVGFYDHAHFIRHFKKATGQTPSGFRTRS